jgi:hypothetical protein
MSHHAEILEADDPGFGYDAGNLPDQETGREMRVIFCAWSFAR